MEYAAGGNLYQLVARSGGLPEPDARWYFQQLIFAIDYCHKMVRPVSVCISVCIFGCVDALFWMMDVQHELKALAFLHGRGSQTEMANWKILSWSAAQGRS
jgi:serine/threonine protein kinase